MKTTVKGKTLKVEFIVANSNTQFGEWLRGACLGYAGRYDFCAKIFDEGSDHGINGGRVSKLEIKNPAGVTIINYDRGWDMKPYKAVNRVYTSILNALENYGK